MNQMQVLETRNQVTSHQSTHHIHTEEERYGTSPYPKSIAYDLSYHAKNHPATQITYHHSLSPTTPTTSLQTQSSQPYKCQSQYRNKKAFNTSKKKNNTFHDTLPYCRVYTVGCLIS
ncbi:hypothetical protein L873DRAFT_1042577 [Choiromyces venosus 120613-1]|uniref:Uncharacterized protein n=1 Tax=Choiromyces venosus 120613-1 TaxID=1336337 RepID=A0A3N4JJI0_9PEZI|nr:hypothetical protein L873DRAFT_1042577 [Choiromyces venosus 120613-1]